MNGRKAKALRRAAYGDLSLKTPRKYFSHRGHGQVVNDPKGPRRAYRIAKRLAKRRVK